MAPFQEPQATAPSTKGRQKTHLRGEIEEELDFYYNQPGERWYDVLRNSHIVRQDRAGRDQRRMA